MVHTEVAVHRRNVLEMVTLTSYTLAHLFIQSHHHSDSGSGCNKHFLQLEISSKWINTLKKIESYLLTTKQGIDTNDPAGYVEE